MRLLYTTILTLLLSSQFLSAQSLNTEVISQSLLEKMAASPTAFHSINVVLADRVDLVALDAELTAKRATAGERSAAVIYALKEKTARTQGRVFDFLNTSPDVEAGSVQSYWIANALLLKAKKEVIAALSHDPQIAWVGLNADRLEFDDVETAPAPPVLSPNGIEPGLAAINAPAMWAMGYTGYGQLSMTSDTGVDPTHPALVAQYHGQYVPKEQTWYEVVGSNQNPSGNYTPYDCSDHGTHVTGTTLGLDRLRNDTIGVAFNAHWIGAQAIVCNSVGNANVGAFQWSLDPDGDPNTAEDMPDVINNSWWDPSLNGNDCFSVYVPIFEATEAAGIAVIYSAGNAGPNPSTITEPKNILINEVNVFCVASVNGNNSALIIAESSSRGPSHCAGDSSLQIKPEVSAPGVSVRSALPGNEYGTKSGTSMAAPHVSGAILLLKEAFPDLTGNELKKALYYSCTDLGIPGEDNTYGMGIINVLAAFNYLMDQGHTPVSPYRANDVMLVNVSSPPFYCGNAINPTILVENAGTDTLYSFKVFYKTTTADADYQWNGMLAPRTRLILTLPSLTVGSGDHELSVGLEEPNGVVDERPLNNKFTTVVTVSDRPHFNALVEGPTNTACQNTTALLRGILPDNLQGTGATMDIEWYDLAFGGSLFGTGEVFTTPMIGADVIFYADVDYIVPTGAPDKNFGGTALFDTTGLGLEFEVFYDLTLEKVHVFLEQTGGVIVKLINLDDGSEKQDITLSQTTGKKEVGLGWDLVPGHYQLILNGGKPLTYNTEGAVFPYGIEDVISITGTTDGKGADGLYYFFYDWEVIFKEPCGRAPVEVQVAPSGSAPVADFTASADTVNVDDNEDVFFTNNSTNGVGWYWNFGDGTTSNEENPSHLFPMPGIYVVSLTTVDQDGCSGSTYQTIVVEESTINDVPPFPEFDKILVFPNPVKDRLSIYIDLPTFKPVSLRLADSTGRVWQQAEHQATGNSSLEMNVAGLPTGIYFLLVETDQGSSVWKVVKM